MISSGDALPIPNGDDRTSEVSIEIISLGGFVSDPSLLQHDAGSGSDDITASTGETLCGVTRAQSLHCWGDPLMVTMRPSDEFFLQVCTAYQFGCAINIDGEIRCWPESKVNPDPFPGVHFTQVLCRDDHMCAIAAVDGSIQCWEPRSAPLTIPSSGGWRSGVMDAWIICGHGSDGSNACWDLNAVPYPTQPIFTVPANHSVVQLSPLRDVTMTFIGAWALTTHGTLKYFPASSSLSSLPSSFPNDDNTTYSQLSGTCALQTNGIVRCFGNGRITYPFGTQDLYVHITQTHFSELVCAVDDDGRVYCANTINATASSSSSPLVSSLVTPLPRSSTPFPLPGAPHGRLLKDANRFPTFYHYYGVTMGLTVTCMLRNDSSSLEPSANGVTVCFGRQMGGDIAFWSTSFNRIAASDVGVCGLTATGDIHCSHLDAHELEPLPMTGASAVELAANGAPCILTNNGSIVCVTWHPCQPPTTLGNGYVNLTVNANGNGACALHINGSFICWGATDATRVVTTSPPGELFREIRISPGDYSVVCALRMNYTAWCWRFARSKATDGVDVSVPSSVLFSSIAPGSINPHSSIKLSFYASCGVSLANSSLLCFGTKYGQLKSAPDANDFTRVWSGGARMCAARHSGDIYCWSEDGNAYSYSEYFTPTYRRTIDISAVDGDDAPFCSLPDFKPCRTLPYALTRHHRIATTFIIDSIDLQATATQFATIDRDGITIRDASYNTSGDQHHSSVININLVITKAHHVQLVGLIFNGIKTGPPAPDRPGGAVMIESSNYLTLISCSFTSNNGPNTGGASLTARYSDTMTCINCVFASNHGYSGAAIWLLASDITCDNTSFTDNIATMGGAVFATDRGAAFTCHHCLFARNQASRGGAMDIMNYADVSLNHVVFIDNQAHGASAAMLGEGGAIALYLQVAATITGVIFIHNSAADEGGAMSIVSCSAQLTQVSFTNNLALSEGGAIYIAGREQAVITISDANFTHNSGDGDGGAIYIEGRNAQIVMDHSLFTQNAADNGAAIAVSTAAAITCTYCDFMDNTAALNGGALNLDAIYSCTVLLQYGTMLRNRAASGAAMALQSTALDMIVNSYMIMSNIAIGPAGGIQITAVKSLTINDTRFEENHAQFDSGGALFAKPQLSSTIHITIRGCIFYRNMADKNGGGISLQDQTMMDISASNFTGNTAAYGGAICANQLPITVGVLMVSNTEFDYNDASADGGAIRCYRANLVLKQSQFNGNTAGGLGGSVMVNGAWSGLKIGCIFMNGRAGIAGGALFWKTYFPAVTDPSTTDFNRLIPNWLRNTTFFNNQAPYAPHVGTTPLWVEATWHGVLLSANSTAFVDSAVMSPSGSGIAIQARDLMGQAVTLDDVRTVEITLWPPQTDVLTSGTLMTCIHGAANFSGLMVYGQPATGGYSLNISLMVVDTDEGSNDARSEHEVTTHYDRVLMIRGCAATTYISGTGAAAMCQSCPEGKFSSLPNQHDCVACMPFNPDISIINCQAGNWSNGAGYWVYENTQRQELSYTPCPSGLCKEKRTCADNRVAYRDNPLCGQCLDDMSESPWTSACIPCNGINWLLVSLGLCTSILYVFCQYHLAQSPRGRVKIFFYFFQTALFILGPKNRWMDWMQILSGDPAGFGDFCVIPLNPYQKMAWNGMQGALFAFNLIMMGILHWCFLKVRRHWQQGGIMAVLLCCCRTQRRRGFMLLGDTDNLFPLAAYIRALTAIFIFSYTFAASAVLAYLKCVDVGPYSVVFASPAIDCNSEKYQRWAVVIWICLIGYVIMGPLTVAIALWWVHRQGELFRDLHKGELPGSVAALRRQSRDAGVAHGHGHGGHNGAHGGASGPSPVALSSSNPAGDAVGPAPATRGNDRIMVVPAAAPGGAGSHAPLLSVVGRTTSGNLIVSKHFASRFGLFYEHYRPEYYWWEPFAVARRMLFVVGSVYFSHDRPTQSTYFILLNGLTLAAQTYARPWLFPNDNRAEFISLVILCIISVLVGVYQDVSPFPLGVQIACVLLICIPSLWLVTSIVRDRLQRHGHCLKSKPPPPGHPHYIPPTPASHSLPSSPRGPRPSEAPRRGSLGPTGKLDVLHPVV